MSTTRRDTVFFVLSGFFLTNALLAEIIGGKLFTSGAIDLGWFRFDPVVLSIGLVPWPVVFLTTDLVNEYYGKPAVRRLTFLAVGMIVYAFLVLYVARAVPTYEVVDAQGRSIGVTHDAFARVAGQSMWIIVGSITAFLTSQLVDVTVFWFFRERTGHRMLWLRATGSTAVSQLIDTFIVQYIGLVLPGILTTAQYLTGAASSYAYKLLVAIAITPLLYVVHDVIDRYLGLAVPRGAVGSPETGDVG